MLILTSGPPAAVILSTAPLLGHSMLDVSMVKSVLVMLMVLLYMYMLMLLPACSGLQVQLTRPSDSMAASPSILLLASASSPTFMEKNVSCMLILLPAIHMLMLRAPVSWDPATETIQSQTSCRVASGPGVAGAWVVVVTMADTRELAQVSSNRESILLSPC